MKKEEAVKDPTNGCMCIRCSALRGDLDFIKKVEADYGKFGAKKSDGTTSFSDLRAEVGKANFQMGVKMAISDAQKRDLRSENESLRAALITQQTATQELTDIIDGQNRKSRELLSANRVLSADLDVQTILAAALGERLQTVQSTLKKIYTDLGGIL